MSKFVFLLPYIWPLLAICQHEGGEYVYQYEWGNISGTDTFNVSFDGQTIIGTYLNRPDRFEDDEGYTITKVYDDMLWELSLKDSMAHECRSLDYRGLKHIDASYPAAIKWTVTDETKQKDGRTLVRAEANALPTFMESSASDMVIAWFDSEIPVPVGPFRYWGLPGLIVELEFPDHERTRFALLRKSDKSTSVDAVQCGEDGSISVPYEVILNPRSVDHKDLR